MTKELSNKIVKMEMKQLREEIKDAFIVNPQAYSLEYKGAILAELVCRISEKL